LVHARRTACQRDVVFRRLDFPVVFVAFDCRLMAFILPGYEIEDVALALPAP